MSDSSPTLSEARLVSVMPRADVVLWAPLLAAALDEARIDTAAARAMFLAQVAVESAELTRLIENLNYSANGLIATWPSRFTPALAAELAHQPERIAEHVYGGRGGNRPEGAGDGWAFRGRGIFQVTFRANYRLYGGELGLPLETEPDLAARPEVAARVAAVFWRRNRISGPADGGDVAAVTRLINGGLNGLAERRACYARALRAFEAPV